VYGRTPPNRRPEAEYFQDIISDRTETVAQLVVVGDSDMVRDDARWVCFFGNDVGSSSPSGSLFATVALATFDPLPTFAKGRHIPFPSFRGSVMMRSSVIRKAS
jgi:hypothetical protein